MRRVAVYTVVECLAAWLLPPRCVLCGGDGQPPALDLCRPCEQELPWLADPGLPLPAASLHCHAPFHYEFPLTRLVPALKYEGALAHARVLGTMLAQSVKRAGVHHEVDAIVPMPLHRSRLQERGFNQSHEIARFVARALSQPVVPDALRRTRATAAQVGLAREARRDNVRDAFAADAGVLRGGRIALLDDVVTTGSTAAAAAQVLLDAGARRVEVWCVARASG
jgi:ComF family protein